MKLKITMLLISCSLIVIGIFREETSIVLAKAVKICFECIGVG